MLNPFRKGVASLLAALATAGAVALLAQTQTPRTPTSVPLPLAPPMNHNLVVLDPAHGGTDNGAKLGEHLLEKDVTLAIAARLKAALTTAGFTVVSTRDAELLTPLNGDQRADTANRTRAVACIVIHATGSGSGVHLYASTLQPQDPQPAADAISGDIVPAFEPIPWDAAQLDWVRQSLRLQSDLGSAFGAANIGVMKSRATVRPLDNLMCPAVAVEIAPATIGSDAASVTDADYQERLTKALTQALQTWRTHADPAGTRPADATVGVPADQIRALPRAPAGDAAVKAHPSEVSQ